MLWLSSLRPEFLPSLVSCWCTLSVRVFLGPDAILCAIVHDFSDMYAFLSTNTKPVRMMPFEDASSSIAIICVVLSSFYLLDGLPLVPGAAADQMFSPLSAFAKVRCILHIRDGGDM